MTVGRRWRLRCHSVPPADRRCFPSSAVLPQPLLASLALGVSPWAHGRGMDWIIGSPDFDRLDRDRIRTPDWDCGLCVHACVVGAHACGRGRSPVFFSSFGSNVQPNFGFTSILRLLPFLLGLPWLSISSFKRLVLAAIALLRMVPMAIGL